MAEFNFDPNTLFEDWEKEDSKLTVPSTDPNSLIEEWGDTPASVDEPMDYTKGGYSVSDLASNDEIYNDILGYMQDRFGTHITKEDDRLEVVDKYLNNMRGFAGGNSVRAVNEIAYLSSLDEEQKARAGRAYSLFENLPSIFNEENTWGDTFEGVWDYTRGAVLDPVNLVGGVIGKSVTSGGFKGVATAANITAKTAYKKALTRGISRGLTKEAAEKSAMSVANRVYQGAGRKIAADQLKRAAARDATLAATKSTLGKMFTTEALKETATMTAIDSLAAGATDYMYQQALMDTDVQDEYSAWQTGIAAGGTLVLGGLMWSTQGLLKRSGSSIGPELADLKTTRKGAKLSRVSQSMAKAIANNKGRTSEASIWLDDVAKGVETKDLDVTFWKTMMLGDDTLGITGLADELVDQGYAYVPANENDSITNFIGDIIKEADPQDYKAFINEFSSATGNPITDIKSLSQEEFVNTFKKKVSDSSKLTNMMAQAANKLDVSKSRLTINELMQSELEGTGLLARLGKGVEEFGSRTIPRTQNRLIRLLVANLGTTQLNLIGWSTASTLDSMTDLVTAAIQVPTAAVKALGTGDTSGLKASSVLVRSQIKKLQNTLDPNTTYSQFLKYAEARPKALREVTHVLPGGIEDVKKLSDDLELDRSIASLRTDQAVDVAQGISLVRAQDSYTKSIEFMTAMDKYLRMPEAEGGFNMTYEQFMKQDGYWKSMNTEKFQKIEQRAINATLDNTMGRTYGNRPGTLGGLAKMTEEARNIPGLGILMPFGRFFNNTIALMSDYSGMSLAGRFVQMGKKGSTEEFIDKAARAVVGWSAIIALSEREEKFIDMGLGWDEQTQLGDVTGAVTTEKYNFPYSFFKGAARMTAYWRNGKDIPSEEFKDWIATVGVESFTRDVVDMFGAGGEKLVAFFSDPTNNKDILIDIGGKILGQVGSAATRVYEPMDAAIGIARGSNRVVEDRRQGNRTWNEVTRYMENTIAVMGGEQEEQRVSPSRGALRPQDSKFFAPVREVKTTNTSRVAKMAGIAEWDRQITMIGEKAPEASNRYAQLYNKTNEVAAGELLDNPQFKEGNLEVRRALAKKMLSANKKLITDYMEANIFGGDDFLMRVAKLHNNYKDKVIKDAANDLGFDKTDLMEYTDEELMLLESALKFREDIILSK